MNGVAENKNQVLQYYAKTMLLHSNLGKQYWAKAVDTANYLVNKLPSSAIGGQIPFTLWTGQETSLAHVWVFGLPSYAYVPEAHRSKFDARSQMLILVGFLDSLKCYKLLHPVTHKPHYARSVIINESTIGHAMCFSTREYRPSASFMSRLAKYTSCSSLPSSVFNWYKSNSNIV